MNKKKVYEKKLNNLKKYKNKWLMINPRKKSLFSSRR